MPIQGDLYGFSKKNVDKAPDSAGVYALFQSGTTIYIGRAQGGSTTIRSRLQDHYAGRGGQCTKSATDYKREVTSNAASREKELLAEYKRQHGKLPKCNDVMP